MAEDRLESVISQTMDDSVIAKVMVKRFEKAYPELKTDSALRDKCADFIDQRIDDEPDKDASFSRIAFLAKFSKAAIDYYDHEKEQKKSAAKPADEYSKFLEEYGLTDDQASQELYAQVLQDKANGTAELVAVEPQTKDPRLAFLESMGLDNTEDNLLMAEEYLKSLENQPTEPMLKSAETNAEAQHEPTYIEKLYIDLNNVMDESYPLVKEYIDIYHSSQKHYHHLVERADKNTILNSTDKKETMYAEDDLFWCASQFIENETRLSNIFKPGEADNLSPLGHAKKAIELVDTLRRNNAGKISGMLAEMNTRGKIAKDAMFEFGEVAATRELAGDTKVAALCTKYPELVMVALVQNGSKPIDNVKQLETLMDNPHNLEMASNYLLESHGKQSTNTNSYEKIKDFVFQKTLAAKSYSGEGR